MPWPAADATGLALRLTRRALLPAALLLGRIGGAAAADARASLFPEGAALLVAGPAGGQLDRFAAALLPALAPALPAGTVLHRDLAGAADGVTGANRFEAQVAPDGGTALLLPGAAMLARLAGDQRARFDIGRLVPVLAGTAPAVMMVRRAPDRGTPTGRLRVAVERLDGPDLAGLLALHLLGIAAVPAPGAPAEASDAVLLRGPDAAARCLRLARSGMRALFGLAVPGAPPQRDPAFPGVPTLAELLGARAAGPLFAAWQAVAACAQLDWLLALLSPTPAAMVALWRQAAAQAAGALSGEPAGDDAAGPPRLLPCPAANAFIAPVLVDAAAQAALHRWLAEQLHWQPA